MRDLTLPELMRPTEDAMNEVAIPYKISLLEDLADPEEAMAYLEAALEDGDQGVIQLALQDVIEAQRRGQDDDLRLSPEGRARFRALMAQAEEGIRACKTLSSDEFWRQAHARADARAAGQVPSPSPTSVPAIAEPRAAYQTDE